MPDDLLQRRLVVVTGKGGVGKSTVAAALGVLAARAGRRAVIAEVGRRGDVLETLLPPADPLRAGGDRTEEDGDLFVERAVPVAGAAGSLHHVSISPEAALREYLRDQLPIAAIADLLGSGKVFTGLTAATPGLRELLALGKVWELAQPVRRTPGARPYDLCILDAPASGHATTMLGAPDQFARTARVGPVARQGATIAATLADPAQTAVVVVATAEELPVSEALELEDTLGGRVGVPVALGVVNGVLPDRFSGAERDALAAGAPHDAAIAAADAHARRAHDQQRQLLRFRRGFRRPVVTLPAAPVLRLGPDDVAALADRLDQGLRRARSAASGDVR
ncbi:ArsA-related P-loop ATPase [Patulibacter minatonensis]|uniref:ArsA-related P-loop ATPase n=1 Tax=Patulibacter minatonensis TaxID=298163 RepID=UPI0004B9CF23|nr:ArsA-related P-loop ATPase [Patulibacter minatonensis]